MVDNRIVQYIQDERSRGYSLQGIRQYLINSGYSPTSVDEAVNHIQGSPTSDPINNQRVQQLASYIQAQLSTYPAETLKQFLIQKGYPPTEVDEAFMLTLPRKAEPPKTRMIIGVIILIIFVSAITSILFNLTFISEYLGVKEGKLLDLKAVKLTSAPKPGSDLVFKTEIYNLGSIRKYDIAFNYELINEDSGKRITGDSEIISLETSTSKIFSVEIPDDANAGNYRMDVRAYYDDQVAEAGFLFKVYARAQRVTKEEAAQDLEEIPTTTRPREEIEEPLEEPTEVIPEPTEEPTVAPPVEIPEEPAGRFDDMTRTEAFDAISQVAILAPGEAASMCTEFDYQGTANSCFIMLAKNIDDGSFCSYIKLNSTKDSCFVQLALHNNNFEFCQNITASNIRSSCEALETVNTFETLAVSNPTRDLPLGVGRPLT